MTLSRRSTLAAGLAALALAPSGALAENYRANLTMRAHEALSQLYATEPRARYLAGHASAVLVFPSVVKGGLIWGAESGNGVLFMGGRPTAYYNTSAASFGLQAGGQKISVAIFFMNGRALGYLHRSGGFAIGTAPNVVVVNQGAAAQINSTTLTQDVVVVPFGQRGLMAGIDIHGSKITPINP